MDNFWYYEYTVKIFDEIDNIEETRSGVIPADSMAEAMKDISGYYGCELLEVSMLKPIVEGPVFEFQEAADNKDFDFTVHRKL